MSITSRSLTRYVLTGSTTIPFNQFTSGTGVVHVHPYVYVMIGKMLKNSSRVSVGRNKRPLSPIRLYSIRFLELRSILVHFTRKIAIQCVLITKDIMSPSDTLNDIYSRFRKFHCTTWNHSCRFFRQFRKNVTR